MLLLALHLLGRGDVAPGYGGESSSKSAPFDLDFKKIQL